MFFDCQNLEFRIISRKYFCKLRNVILHNVSTLIKQLKKLLTLRNLLQKSKSAAGGRFLLIDIVCYNWSIPILSVCFRDNHAWSDNCGNIPYVVNKVLYVRAIVVYRSCQSRKILTICLTICARLWILCNCDVSFLIENWF